MRFEPPKDGARRTGGVLAWMARNSVASNMLMVALIFGGLVFLTRIKQEVFPEFALDVIAIQVPYPGASPSEVERGVTKAIEENIRGLDGVKTVTSVSREGLASITVELQLDSKRDRVLADVKAAVDRITSFPEDVEEPRTSLVEFKNEVLSLMVYGDASEKSLRAIADGIRDDLLQDPNVSRADLSAVRPPEISVNVPRENLRAYGLTLEQVAAAIRAANIELPAGGIKTSRGEILLRTKERRDYGKDFSDIVVLGQPDGTKVMLSDIAVVDDSFADTDQEAQYNGKPSAMVKVFRIGEQTPISVSDAVQKYIANHAQDLPPGVELAIWNDRSEMYRARIDLLMRNAFMGLALVLLCLGLFLEIRLAFWVTMGIPISFLGAILFLPAWDVSINMISLFAFIVTLGIVVDDAIVVLENNQRKRSEGLGPKAAAVVGAREVFFAVLATTATLVAVFVPISFLPSAAGRLFTEFGYLLAIAIILSSFVALSLAPMMASRIGDLGEPDGGSTGLLARVGQGASRGYAVALRRVLAAPFMVLVIAGLAAAWAAMLYTDLGQELTPTEDRGAVTVFTEGPDGAALTHTDKQVAAVEAMFAPWVEQGVGQGVYSVSGRWDLNRGSVGMRLAPWDERTVSQAEIEEALRPQLDALPGVRARIRRPNSLGLRGSATGGGLSLALTGTNYDEIAAAAYALADQLEESPGLSNARVQYQATQPQLSIGIDRSRAADLGVSMTALSTTLRALIDEDEVAELTVGDQRVPIMLHSRAGAVRDPADLLNLYVRADGGALIPLSQLVSLTETGVAAELDRHGQRRAVEIDLSRSGDMKLSDAVEQARALAQQSLPPGVGLQFLGEAATLEETADSMVATYVIAVLVVFLVLVAQFESVTSALVVMLTVPFGVCAAILALWLTGGTVNIFSQIGVLMLIGILAKNGILMVEFADQLRDRGASVRAAAYEAAQVRLRPITMTLVSTVLAGLPLILGSGPGAEARAAIGWVIFGGLGLAAVFTLFLTPAAYVLVAGWSKARGSGAADLEQELDDALIAERRKQAQGGALVAAAE